MKICSGDVEIRALGAFSEHAYQCETNRRVLRMRLLEVPTPAQLEALCAGPIELRDDSGAVLSSYAGFNAVYECYLALGVYGPEELAYLAEQARAEAAERELAALRQEIAALKAAQPENMEGGLS